ncbi:hypothetical protein KR009_002691 [Drosophila setifemur]|nr:hypothetical protein KR009_002691 [Drosophila setifemur]
MSADTDTESSFGQSFRQLVVRGPFPGVLHIEFTSWHRRTIYELMRVLDLANGDASIHVVVLSGDWCVRRGGGPGATDPLELQQGQGKRWRQLPEEQRDHPDQQEELYIHEKAANFVMRSLAKKVLGQRKLLVAFVEGQCLGLGLSVCSLCDLVFATRSASFEPAFSHLDPCVNTAPNWSQGHIRWLLLLGEQADARAARDSGVVVGVVKDAQEFWNRMVGYARLPSASLISNKRLLLRHCWRNSLMADLREESTPMASQRRRLARSGPASKL